MMRPERQPLSDIPIGGWVEVAGVTGDQSTRWRLMDLGLVSGTRVEVLRASPLGDPVVYRFRGTTIALRRPDAEQVQVYPLQTPGLAVPAEREEG